MFFLSIRVYRNGERPTPEGSACVLRPWTGALISAKYTEIRQSEPFVVRLTQATPLGKRAFRSAGKRGEIIMSQPLLTVNN